MTSVWPGLLVHIVYGLAAALALKQAQTVTPRRGWPPAPRDTGRTVSVAADGPSPTGRGPAVNAAARWSRTTRPPGRPRAGIGQLNESPRGDDPTESADPARSSSGPVIHTRHCRATSFLGNPGPGRSAPVLRVGTSRPCPPHAAPLPDRTAAMPPTTVPPVRRPGPCGVACFARSACSAGAGGRAGLRRVPRWQLGGPVDSADAGLGASAATGDGGVGDPVVLRTADRPARAFVVTDALEVATQALPPQLFTRDGPPRPALVPARGESDGRTDHLVVLAAPVCDVAGR